MALSGFLNGLFGQSKYRALSQEQNEALIDAMTYAMLIDQHIAAAEQTQLAAELQRLAWRSPMPAEQYVNASILRAREAVSLPDAARSYCHRISARLASPQLREEAFSISARIAHADGVVDARERALLDTMAEAFGLDEAQQHTLLQTAGLGDDPTKPTP